MRRLLVLVIVTVIAVHAYGQRSPDKQLTYGDWTVMLSEERTDLIAATSQDDDKFLAYRCFTSEGKCAHVIVTATRCEEGGNYPVLINASSGSLTVDCLCSENENGTYELVPKNFDNFHNTLTESSGYIGFAIPLESGQFKVIRFSLNGAKRAMTAAEAAIRKKDSAEYH